MDTQTDLRVTYRERRRAGNTPYDALGFPHWVPLVIGGVFGFTAMLVPRPIAVAILVAVVALSFAEYVWTFPDRWWAWGPTIVAVGVFAFVDYAISIVVIVLFFAVEWFFEWLRHRHHEPAASVTHQLP